MSELRKEWELFHDAKMYKDIEMSIQALITLISSISSVAQLLTEKVRMNPIKNVLLVLVEASVS